MNFIPPGYVLVAATSGPGPDNNVAGERIHELPERQDLN